MCKNICKKSILSVVILFAVILTFAINNVNAAFPAPPGFLIPPGLPGSSFNVHVDGYLPAPPGVNVRIDSGRPYYIERERRVYIEREPVRHDNRRYYKKHKKHHNDRGRGNGHGRWDRDNDHDRHGRGNH